MHLGLQSVSSLSLKEMAAFFEEVSKTIIQNQSIITTEGLIGLRGEDEETMDDTSSIANRKKL